MLRKQASQQACLPSQAWKHLPLIPTFVWQMELGRNKRSRLSLRPVWATWGCLFCFVFEDSPSVALAILELGDLNGFASPVPRLKVCTTTSLALLFNNKQHLLSMCLCLCFYTVTLAMELTVTLGWGVSTPIYSQLCVSVHFGFLFGFQAESLYKFLVVLGLTMQTSWFGTLGVTGRDCPCLSSAGIKGLCCHIWLTSTS